MPNFVRKPNRLHSFDYATPARYFITVCARDRKCVFREEALSPLTPIGEVTLKTIESIPNTYPGVSVDQYVIMPNHIHLILCLTKDNTTSVSTIIQQMKRIVTMRTGQSVWQKTFHDHVIRNEENYLRIREYIVNNPWTWSSDCFYMQSISPQIR